MNTLHGEQAEQKKVMDAIWKDQVITKEVFRDSRRDADEMQTRPGLNSESGGKRIETREGTERGKR